MTEVIQLGQHRLLCGDATNKEDVTKLIGNHKVNLLLTDPPYGIDIVKTNTTLGGGETSNIQAKSDTKGVRASHHSKPRRRERERERALRHNRRTRGTSPPTIQEEESVHNTNIQANNSNTHTHTPNNGKIIEARTYKPVIGDNKPFNPEHLLRLGVPTILFGGNYYADKLPQSNKWLVWYKKPSLDGKRNHFSDCELMWTNLQGKKVDCYHHTWSGMVRKGNRRIELQERVHPTQKPVGLLSQIITDYTKPGDTVLDLYGGSGSTLIACEETGRKCLMMELSKDYVNIIRERYLAYVKGESTIKVDDECVDEHYVVSSLDSWLT